MSGDLQEKLAQPLAAGRVKSRPNGRGGQLSYIETHDAIRTANEIFGFGKWGHEIVQLLPLAATTVHNSDQKPGVCVGYVCVVKLTVEGCVATTGIGYGDGTEYRESASVTAHELAAKEAESDGLKRALKNFGDQFGLALYDKDAARSGHIASVTTPASAATQDPRESTRPGFIDPNETRRSEAQAKMLHALLPKMVKAGFLTDQAFIDAAKIQGATGDTVNQVIDSVSKATASTLISRLKKLEDDDAKAAA